MSPGGNLLSLGNQAPATRGIQGVGTRSTGASNGSQGVIVSETIPTFPSLPKATYSVSRGHRMNVIAGF